MSALATLGAALAACGATATTAPASEPKSTTAAAVETTAPQAAPVSSLSLEWWGFPLGLPEDSYPHGKWEGDLAAAYSAQHPEVTINFQALGWEAIEKLQMAVTAGTPPNLLCQGGATEYILMARDSGTAVEVELPEDFQADVIDGWLDSMKYAGKIWAVPLFCAAGGMMINVSRAEETGATDLIPTAPDYTWDFDQLLEFMKKTSDPESAKWGYYLAAQQSSAYYFWPEQVLSWCWGTDTIQAADGTWKCRFDEEAGIAWWQWMQDLAFKHNVMPNPSGSSESRYDIFKQGACSVHMGVHVFESWKSGCTVDPETLLVDDTEKGFQWRFVQPPTNAGVAHASYWGGGLLDFSNQPFKTDNPDLVAPAVDFALFVSNEENQKFLAQYLLPIRKSAVASIESPLLSWYFENCVPYGRSRLEEQTGSSAAVVEQLMLLIQKIYLETPVKEAVSEFCTAIDAIEFKYPPAEA